MESVKRLVCSSTINVLYKSTISVQEWLERVQQETENCLAIGYESSLLKEIYVDLAQNDKIELSAIWGQIDEV